MFEPVEGGPAYSLTIREQNYLRYMLAEERIADFARLYGPDALYVQLIQCLRRTPNPRREGLEEALETKRSDCIRFIGGLIGAM